MKTALGKQEVMYYKQIIIKRGDDTNCSEKVEQDIPALLRCFRCQKYGLRKESCRGYLTYRRCGQKDPTHMEEDCLNEIKCLNCPEIISHF